jgi:hypothetical protein
MEHGISPFVDLVIGILQNTRLFFEDKKTPRFISPLEGEMKNPSSRDFSHRDEG